MLPSLCAALETPVHIANVVAAFIDVAMLYQSPKSLGLVLVSWRLGTCAVSELDTQVWTLLLTKGSTIAPNSLTVGVSRGMSAALGCRCRTDVELFA